MLVPFQGHTCPHGRHLGVDFAPSAQLRRESIRVSSVRGSVHALAYPLAALRDHVHAGLARFHVPNPHSRPV